MSMLLERAFVWAGGALFVSSLALTAWTYGVMFDAGSGRPDWRAVAIDGALVTLFAAHHSLFAREHVKLVTARVVPDRLLRSVYVWIASALLILVCLLWQPVGGDLYRAPSWLTWPCRLLQLVGALTIASSVTAIHPLELAGIRPLRKTDSLQSNGPYGLVRHPLYLGWILLLFPAGHMTGDRLAFAVSTTLYLLIAMPWEERSLERAFGPGYSRYKERVPWRVIPYIY